MAQTHHFLFDSATNFTDSMGGYNFTPVSGSIISSGKINQCAFWTVLDCANNGPPFAGFGSPFSIAFWLKSDSSGQYGTLFECGNISIKIDDMVGAVEIWNSSLTIGPEFTVTVGGFSSWRHIVLICDGTYYWDLYSNGSYLGSFSTYYSALATGFTTIKSCFSGGTSLDDLRYYDNQIDSTEVAFIYNSGSGTQADSGGGAGSASGSLSTVVLYEPSGSAFGSAGPGAAIGSLGTITIDPMSGIAGTNGIASGMFSTVLISSFSGIAFPEYIAYGSLPSITVSAIEAIPVIQTTIQLDYVACDGEITWTQTLPITGFSSAIQGQDAISSRITPTIGASGANIVFFEQRTIAASGSYTYDLTSLTDFLGGALSLSRAYAITITPTSGTARLAPGASNPFQWFFASTTSNISLSQGDAFMFAQPESATITSGSKTLVVTNTSGAASLTYKIAILGGR